MMKIEPFKLERYFAEYEFKARYLLSPSDCESLSLAELLGLADAESLRLWEQLALGYTETAGHPLLREEIAGLYPGVGAEGVMVAAPEEAIFIAMQTLLKPGEHAVALFPAYQSLYAIAEALGCRVTRLPLELGSAGWRLDLDRLADSLSARTRLLVINFPHNPTGYLPSRQELEAILDLARPRGIVVFSDEMYRLLEYDPQDTLPPVCSIYERGVSLSGLSKTYALPGLRLGWLATQELGLLKDWLALKDYTTICNSAPSEMLGIMALRAKETIARRSLEIILGNLQHAAAFFAEHPRRFDWIKPRAGSVAYPRWLGERPVEAFCQELLEQKGVLAVPGSLFNDPGQHFRLGLGRRNLPEVLDQVDSYLSGK
ncbi:MAG TPA: aminotransferase class I/II-fold pyridoxal phosphate-dependent enzyme [Anaerolineales bacterium]|nr:aminotransferase class I/II-fold pyridoxal phosphate-dependent enzyme [Anaerolineales bacterium]